MVLDNKTDGVGLRYLTPVSIYMPQRGGVFLSKGGVLRPFCQEGNVSSKGVFKHPKQPPPLPGTHYGVLDPQCVQYTLGFPWGVKSVLS